MNFDPAALARTLTPRLVAWRRDLHRHPETGWTEFRSTALVCAALAGLGFDVRLGKDAVRPEARMGVPGPAELEAARRRALEDGADPALVARMGDGLTGAIADLDSGLPGPTLALRADLDALAVPEADDLDHFPAREGFASRRPGLMHACGHDAHTALALGLAAALAPLLRERRLRGRLRLLFQPAEEGVRGARAMLEAGALEGVTHLLGLHVGLKADAAGGLICSAEDFLATSKLEAAFSAAAPGGDALQAACAAVLGLHALPRHGGGPTRINAGLLRAGEHARTRPRQARLLLETRGATTEINARLEDDARRVLEAAAAMHGCACAATLRGQASGGRGSPELADLVREAARASGRFGRIEERAPFGASEDFGTLLSAVQARGGQSVFLLLGADLASGHHTARFDFDEAALPAGLELLIRAASAVLNSAASKDSLL